ncbi:MAG: methylmalonyl Co-A mutase-associated GTPase MeaB [Cyclobacteriaceae bacterium]|nr:methylmalonyl Co-A mutase-associated GTPase MeaB [Cyclobacteriaceae bacterium]
MPAHRPALTPAVLEKGICSGDRTLLARAITMAESTKPVDQKKISSLLKRLLPRTGKSIRIGITGVPGVGKSTFIEVFGELLARQGKKIGVLTVDPTSQKTKGSILGDKTRMERLSRHPNVFIRPSPTGHALGGVTFHTREAILLCEAAGFDVILIETVGVGQSETIVRGMVDFFLLLVLAGAGDELQGIKKGIMEMADGIVVTKADGENIKAAKQAQADALQALHFQEAPASGWKPKVLTTSSTEGKGIEAVWKMIEDFEMNTKKSGYFGTNRNDQQEQWLEESVALLFNELMHHSTVLKQKTRLMKLVRKNQLLPTEAAQVLWKLVRKTAG